ncbi:MAG TPA: hypothetical protein VN257_10070 [Actinotalea sp.]|nr:hypothetical protein [Actinotalea sp.]
MDDHTPAPGADDVARLAQVDPAAHLEPDARALRAAVDARTASVPDELATARARRRATWPVRVAGIAAAALVVGGGGGYALGAAGDDPAPAAAAITLSDGSGGPLGAPAGAESATDASQALGSPAGMSRTSDLPWWGGWGRTVFTSTGLSSDGGTHAAWALDAAAVFSEATITSAAAVLGVPGAPTLVDGYWLVGATDGTGPSLTLSPDGTASLGYYDPTKDPWSCATVTKGGGEDGSTTTPDQTVAPEPDPCVQRDLGPAPTGDALVAQFRDLLSSLGQDPAGYEFVGESFDDPTYSYVSAYQVLEGQRTGLAWTGSYTGAGLQSLYGTMAPVVELGAYDVVSPVEAVQRLGDPRFGVSGGGPIAYAEGAMVREGAAVESSDPAVPAVPTVPPTVTPGSPLSWPVTEVTIVSARLGVAVHTQTDGATVLAPTYELTGSDGGIWTVLAVVDAALDFTPVG